jgi:hypothetical protein
MKFVQTFCGKNLFSLSIIALCCVSLMSYVFLQADISSRAAAMPSRTLSSSFIVDGLLRGLDYDPKIQRFPHEFQIEFLESVVPRLVPSSRMFLAACFDTSSCFDASSEWLTVSN